MSSTTKASADQIERELGELLDRETFDPPEEFAKHALISDDSVYEEAAERSRGLVGQAGRGARLVRALGQGARRLRGRPSTSGSRAGS